MAVPLLQFLGVSGDPAVCDWTQAAALRASQADFESAGRTGASAVPCTKADKKWLYFSVLCAASCGSSIRVVSWQPSIGGFHRACYIARWLETREPTKRAAACADPEPVYGQCVACPQAEPMSMSISDIVAWFEALPLSTQISFVVFFIFIALPIATLILLQFLESLRRLRELSTMERRRDEGDDER
jgi:hypothetical protein